MRKILITMLLPIENYSMTESHMDYLILYAGLLIICKLILKLFSLFKLLEFNKVFLLIF